VLKIAISAKGVCDMQKKLKIEGMSCEHCKMTVEKALKGVAGVESAVVDLDSETALVTLSGAVADEALFAAVRDMEYDPISIEDVA
jgi:copper chaperone CopZ